MQLPKFTTRGRAFFCRSSSFISFPSSVTNTGFGASQPRLATFNLSKAQARKTSLMNSKVSTVSEGLDGGGGGGGGGSGIH